MIDRVQFQGGTYDLTRTAYHKRNTGLFKVEYRGEGGIALCPKSCLWWGDYQKCSMKGMVRSLFQKEHDEDPAKVKQTFLDALAGKAYTGENRGIRRLEGKMYTYSQRRQVLSNFFDKAVCHPDHTVTPLEL